MSAMRIACGRQAMARLGQHRRPRGLTQVNLPACAAPTIRSMGIPLQISLHGVPASDALYDAVRARVDRLERCYSRVTACHVIVELAARQRTSEFAVRIGLKVPGGEIAVTHPRGENLQAALRDAFDAARRQLEDYARTQRGDVKRHTVGP
jgi:ribosome-associated translation inhibitor RaiA